MPDIEGIFEDSLLSLFDHRPIAFSTAGPTEPYHYAPSPIRYLFDGTAVDFPGSGSYAEGSHVKVHLPIAPPGLHSTLQLTHIWLSSVFLADLITYGAIPVMGERICELGAGAGLPGIVAARNGASTVVSTDYAVPATTTMSAGGGEGKDAKHDAQPTDVLAVLRRNFHRALPESEESRNWQVTGHTWGDSVSPILASCTPGAKAEKFPVLLLADLLWTTAAHESLITSVRALLCPHRGIAHVVAGLHEGRGAVERFRSAWAERGGWVRDALEVQWGSGGWEVLRDLRDGCEGRRGVVEEGADEHGTVIYFKIGMRDDP